MQNYAGDLKNSFKPDLYFYEPGILHLVILNAIIYYLFVIGGISWQRSLPPESFRGGSKFLFYGI
jgi:hypothetical protein